MILEIPPFQFGFFIPIVFNCIFPLFQGICPFLNAIYSSYHNIGNTPISPIAFSKTSLIVLLRNNSLRLGIIIDNIIFPYYSLFFLKRWGAGLRTGGESCPLAKPVRVLPLSSQPRSPCQRHSSLLGQLLPTLSGTLLSKPK